MPEALPGRARARGALLSVAVLALFASLAAFAARADAAELLYWDNFEANTIATANIDGTGGGLLSNAGVEITGPEGMAIDTAGGRLFVANVGTGSEGKGQGIVTLELDGSGASAFGPPGAVVDLPEGIAIDPALGMVYWANTGAGASQGSIAWAKLDGSAAGLLNTSGAPVEQPYRLAVDPVGGKVYWANSKPAVQSIGFANANNTGGGGTLDLSGAKAPTSIQGFATDPVAGRLYWINDQTGQEEIAFAALAGGGGGQLGLAGAVFDNPYGLALDPALGRIVWANYGQGELRPTAFGVAALNGSGGGGINIATAPLKGPQDPDVLKSPSGTAKPKATRSKKSRSLLECSTGKWAEGNPGGFVFQSPTTYAYQWKKKGKAIKGATKPKLSVTAAAKYSCTVTAANQAGSTRQTSLTLNIKKASLKLTTKAKVSAKPGATASFAVKAANTGDLKSGKAKVCVKFSGAAKSALKAPGCSSLGKLAGGKKKTAKLTLGILASAAPGTYKLTFQPKGASGKPARATVVVSG